MDSYVTQQELWNAIREFGSEMPFSSTVVVKVEVTPELLAGLGLIALTLALIVIALGLAAKLKSPRPR